MWFQTIVSKTLNGYFEGNVVFGKGLRIRSINNQEIGPLLDRTWFTNRDAQILGNLEFKTMRFEQLFVNVRYVKFNTSNNKTFFLRVPSTA